MTVCNMSIEAGARAGMIAPDETTFDYLRGREFVPRDFDAAVARWRQVAQRSGRPIRQSRWCSTPPTSRRKSPGARTPARWRRSTGQVPDPAELANDDRSQERGQRAGLHGL